MTKGRHSAICRVTLLSCLLLSLAAAGQDEEQRATEDLERVREAIADLEQDLARNREKRSGRQQSLREAELNVAAQRKAVHETSRELAASRDRQKAIAEQQNEQQKQLAAHQDALASQLRSAYVSGRQERIRLMLNQENPATLGRIMVYYDYLNRRRATLLTEVDEGLARLRELDREAGETVIRLQTLEAERRDELDRLEQARGQRGEAVAALDAEIEQAGSRLQTMQSQEQELQTLLQNLSRALADIPIDAQDPFAGARGRLPWPLRGRLINDFGQPRAGGRLRWQGVMLSADRGTDVRAVYHGRVAYADWLPGMGLLLVIEHGDGFLSLYGHNEALFVEVGDWVDAGNVVGSVGDSGGNQQPALYFEIRQGTRPLNPHSWLASR